MKESIRKWSLRACKSSKVPSNVKAKLYYAMLNGGND